MSTFGDFKSPFSKESSEEEALSGALGQCTLRHNNHTSTTLSSLSNSSSLKGGEDEETDLEVASLTNGKMGSSPCSSSSSSTGHQPKPENGKMAAKRRRAPDMQLGRCKWVRLFDNITYIVAAIILREGPPASSSNGTNGNHSSTHGLQMLLIQEAKKKCLGKWYIPAGRMEPGETIEQGVQREVLEETGFNCSVDQLVCTEIRGSGWYRMGFACSITGGELKTVPDRESLCAGWHSVDTIKSCMDASSSGSEKCLQLRCRDFFQILDEAIRYHDWKKSIPASIAVLHTPLLNINQAQPGLFIEFVIVSMGDQKIECLVHGSVSNDKQLLQELDPFPTVEFGFEFFFAMVVSKCYRHILEDGHQAIDLPSSVIGMWCLPAPVESLRQGLRLRILCRHKRSVNKAAILVPNRYHWLNLEDQAVLASLYLLPNQFRPSLYLL